MVRRGSRARRQTVQVKRGDHPRRRRRRAQRPIGGREAQRTVAYVDDERAVEAYMPKITAQSNLEEVSLIQQLSSIRQNV